MSAASKQARSVLRDAVAERVRTAPPLSQRQRDLISGLLRPVLRRRRRVHARKVA